MRGIAPRRRAGWIIVAIGIGFTVLAAVGDWLRLDQPFLLPDYQAAPTFADALPRFPPALLEALAAAGLMVLLFSRSVPRWWSLVYAVGALGQWLALISWGADIAAGFSQRLQAEGDAALFGARPPSLAHYIVIGCRLALGVAATLAIAAPLLLPPRPTGRRTDVPLQPLGLDS